MDVTGGDGSLRKSYTIYKAIESEKAKLPQQVKLPGMRTYILQ